MFPEMGDTLERLKERLAQVTDLGKVARLLSWDQQTMMPPAGTQHRAEQFSTLMRIAHEMFTDPEVGRLLDELRPVEDSLDPDSDDAALIRLTRRDYEKSVKVPAELRAKRLALRPRRGRSGSRPRPSRTSCRFCPRSSESSS